MANETVNGLTLRVTVQGSVVGSNGVRQAVDYTYEQVFSDGTGNNQVGSVIQRLARPLNATTETLDMDGETDFKGTAMTDNTAVKFILARLRDTATGAVMKMGGGDFAAASGPLVDSTDKAATGPDGLILLVNPRDGWPITASTKDGLLMELTTNSSYDFIAGVDNT